MTRQRPVWLVATISLALMTLMPERAVSQTVSKTVELLPGGRTIGGPGAFQGSAGGTEDNLFEADVRLPLCVTLANLGAVTVGIRVYLQVGLAPSVNNVFPQRTRTICNLRATSTSVIVSATCAAGSGTCKYLWRVDRAD